MSANFPLLIASTERSITPPRSPRKPLDFSPGFLVGFQGEVRQEFSFPFSLQEAGTFEVFFSHPDHFVFERRMGILGWKEMIRGKMKCGFYLTEKARGANLYHKVLLLVVSLTRRI